MLTHKKQITLNLLILLLLFMLPVHSLADDSVEVESSTTTSETIKTTADVGGQATTSGKIKFTQQSNETSENADSKKYVSVLPQTGEITKSYQTVGILIIVITFLIFLPIIKRRRESEK